MFRPSDEKLLARLHRRGGPSRIDYLVADRPVIGALFYGIPWGLTMLFVVPLISGDGIQLDAGSVATWLIGGLLFGAIMQVVAGKSIRRGIELWEAQEGGSSATSSP